MKGPVNGKLRPVDGLTRRVRKRYLETDLRTKTLD